MAISNPLASPLFAPVAQLCAGLLGLALVLLALVGRRRVLLLRWLSWLGIAVVFGGAVLSGPLALAALAAALGWQGAREYGRLVGLGRERWVLAAAAILLPGAALLGGAHALLVAALAAGLAATLPALLEQDVAAGPRRAALVLLGVAYVPLALALLVLLADRPALVIGLALAVALADVGAFVVGRTLGRRALARRLSPSKTREGVVGALLGAALGLWLAPTGLPILLAAPLVGIGAVWGDLFESLLKRAAQVKDSGSALPGFGGLLDRVDSLLFALPLVYALASLS